MSTMSHRLTKEELDAQFEQFLKESVSDDSLDFGGADKQPLSKPVRRSAAGASSPWRQDEQRSSGETERAEGTKRSFLKARKSQQEGIQDVNVDNLDKPVPKPRSRGSPGGAGGSPGGSRGSPGGSGGSPGGSRGSPPAVPERRPDDPLKRTSVGLDTLEEEEEKSVFFSQLEAEASSSIDYCKLNQELDSTPSSTLRKAEQQNDEAEILESSRSATSPHYSEDFEEEETVKEEKPKMSPILGRVCFYESLDESGGEDGGTDTAGDKGRSWVQSSGGGGGSEMEALQEAYQQIHVARASEDEGETMPPPPSPPPSLQPASTTQSDLPTAEELMKPIRPGDASVLQLLSSVALDQETGDETPRPLGQTFTAGTLSESRWAEPPAGRGAAGRRGRGSAPPGPRSPDRTCSVRRDVARRVQDQSGSPTPSHAGRAKKGAASRSRGRALDRSPARGRTLDRSPAAPPRAAASLKLQSPASSRVRQPPPPDKPSPTREAQQGADEGPLASSQLVASVRSLVSVLQQQIGHVHPEELQTRRGGAEEELQTRRGGAEEEFQRRRGGAEDELQRRRGGAEEELQRRRLGAEEELQRRRAGAEEELQVLRQQNFLLQSQLAAAEAALQRLRLDAADPATQQKLQQLDRDVREQETLIRGYQQENEKLCEQMKAQRDRTRSTQEAMFQENQRLLGDLASTREQLRKSLRPAGSFCRMDHSRRITELLEQNHTLQRTEASLSEELQSLKVENGALKVENGALKVELQLVQKDKELSQVLTTSGDRRSEVEALEVKHREEVEALEVKHREEVEALKKKLQWFTENQELLDRDAGRLKAATAQILELRQQVEKLKEGVGRRGGEQQRRSRARSVETKRLQELQSQVKQLELILRSRNPSSLPALIYAAAAAGEDQAAAAAAEGGGRITALLERRIQRLEAELESHDEDAKRSLRSMELQFDRIKLRYEQQVSELQQKLQQQEAAAAAGSASESWTSKLRAAEETLQLEQRRHREEEEALREQLRLQAPPTPGRRQRHADEASASRLERLNRELSAKTRSVQELQRTVERLQRERRNVLSGPRRPPSPQSPPAAPHHHHRFPSAQYEKTYQPTVFSGSHISEVLRDKEALLERVEQQEVQLQQEKEARQAEAQRAEEERCRVKELFTQQISSMKAEHLREVELLRSSHALQHSSSRAAELSNQLSAQEVTIQHLQEQLEEQRGVREALVLSRTREEVLQEQVSRLLQQLKEATDGQSPEVKLLRVLQQKMVSMELRHQQRELQLQEVMGGSQQGAAGHSEVERWRRVAQEKSRQMEAFRLELDSILDVLRHLQRQGGVLYGPQSVPQRS